MFLNSWACFSLFCYFFNYFIQGSLIVDYFSSITNLEDQWKKWIEEHLSHEQTITNCLISAAYICYCGPFERDIRLKFCESFGTLCSKYEIPKEPQQLFKVKYFLSVAVYLTYIRFSMDILNDNLNGKSHEILKRFQILMRKS